MAECKSVVQLNSAADGSAPNLKRLEPFRYNSAYSLKRMHELTTGVKSTDISSYKSHRLDSSRLTKSAHSCRHVSSMQAHECYPFLLTGCQAILCTPNRPTRVWTSRLPKERHFPKSEPSVPASSAFTRISETSPMTSPMLPSVDQQAVFALPSPRPHTSKQQPASPFCTSDFGFNLERVEMFPENSPDDELAQVAHKHIHSLQILSCQNRRSRRHDSVKGLLNTLCMTSPRDNPVLRPRTTGDGGSRGGFRNGLVKAKTKYELTGNKSVSSSSLLKYSTGTPPTMSPRGVQVADPRPMSVSGRTLSGMWRS